jgi:hypothetical protein
VDPENKFRKQKLMRSHIQIRTVYLIAAVAIALVIALGASTLWFMQKVSVGASRHALNHQEAPKDILLKEVHPFCKSVNAGRYWVNEGDQSYIVSPYATSNKVFRYIVLHSDALEDSSCIQGLIAAAKKIDYSLSVVFTNQGKSVAHFYFEREGK